MKVHILATCRKEELLPATTMVFKTLRTGFPTADVTVWLNSLFPMFKDPRIVSAYESVDAGVTTWSTIHHEWILHLLDVETEPFWICDTDVVFWKSVEDWIPKVPMMGCFNPRFFDRFTNCETMSRLHTSLLYFDPAAIKSEVEKYFSQFSETPFNPRPNLIYPGFFPSRWLGGIKNFFHDTCCLLYHAIGGNHFTDEMKDAYSHLFFGTISDLVAPHYPGEEMRQFAFRVFDNPELLRGAWRAQDAWFKRHAV